jgi:hypothetical protein
MGKAFAVNASTFLAVSQTPHMWEWRYLFNTVSATAVAAGNTLEVASSTAGTGRVLLGPGDLLSTLYTPSFYATTTSIQTDGFKLVLGGYSSVALSPLASVSQCSASSESGNGGCGYYVDFSNTAREGFIRSAFAEKFTSDYILTIANKNATQSLTVTLGTGLFRISSSNRL